MSRSAMPNIGEALLRIHVILSRGLEVITGQSQIFAQQGCPDRPTYEGFMSYIHSFVSVLDAHHKTEEQVAFPYFRDTFPDGPYDLLIAQHRTLVSILDQIKTLNAEVPALGEPGEFFNDLCRHVGSVDEFWHPHIRIEEDYFTVDRMGERIAPEEQIRMCKLLAEHSQKLSGPDFLVVPFLLYNLPPEERSILAADMPPIVTEQLVPFVWKEKWEPMKPFLLD